MGTNSAGQQRGRSSQKPSVGESRFMCHEQDAGHGKTDARKPQEGQGRFLQSQGGKSGEMAIFLCPVGALVTREERWSVFTTCMLCSARCVTWELCSKELIQAEREG